MTRVGSVGTAVGAKPARLDRDDNDGEAGDLFTLGFGNR
jgi:hypothetical protein